MTINLRAPKSRSVFSMLIGLIFNMTVAYASAEPQLVGQAQMKKLGFHIYDIRLYTDSGQYFESSPLQLDIDYKVNIKRQKLIEVSASEVNRTGGVWLPQWSEDLSAIWPNVSKGDQLTLVIESDGTSTFRYNGVWAGSIADPLFGKSFAAIWLSKETREPKLRAKLIGERK